MTSRQQLSWSRWHLPVLVMATICLSFVSASYFQSLLAWTGTTLLLFFMRTAAKKSVFWMGFAGLLASSLANGYESIPFPFPVLFMICLVGSLITSFLFMADRFVSQQSPSFAGTLFFPAVRVAYEYLSAFGGSGTWSSVANTQFEHHLLIQLASLTGIWGISFMLYWFASLVVWMNSHHFQWARIRAGIWIYVTLAIGVTAFGLMQSQRMRSEVSPKVTVGSFSVDNLALLEAAYHDYTGNTIHLDHTIAQNAPVLQEAQKGLLAFLQNPGSPQFQRTARSLQLIQDSLFELGEEMARRGARILFWSEANAMALKADEEALIARGRAFARTHQVYLVMPMGILHPGKILPDSKWLENKLVFIGPDGTILLTYYKNIPVPGVEPSVTGNGLVPVVNTKYGKVAAVICYDADFPRLMRQAGKGGAQLLLIPSGDWKAIAPIHSYMAVLRGIENGCPVVRQVSNGLSVSALPDGTILNSLDYFKPGNKMMLSEVPVMSVATMYKLAGDWFGIGTVVLAIVMFFVALIKRKASKGEGLPNKNTQTSGVRECPATIAG